MFTFDPSKLMSGQISCMDRISINESEHNLQMPPSNDDTPSDVESALCLVT